MITPEQEMERTIEALCDELYWGLRCFYAYNSLYQTELRITPTLFDTFYFACLDQACLLLSRIVIAKEKLKNDESVTLKYLFRQAKNNPVLFRFAKPSEIEIWLTLTANTSNNQNGEKIKLNLV